MRNLLADVTLKEVVTGSAPKKPMGLNESECTDKNADFETRAVLQATTIEELRELTKQNEKAFYTHFKTLAFNEHLKKTRDDILTERRKKPITVIDIEFNQAGQIVICNDNPPEKQ